MDGDMGRNPLFHWMSLFADSTVGKDFDEGLAHLERIARDAIAAPVWHSAVR